MEASLRISDRGCCTVKADPCTHVPLSEAMSSKMTHAGQNKIKAKTRVSSSLLQTGKQQRGVQQIVSNNAAEKNVEVSRTASKKYCENFTASRVADVTISFSCGLFLTACNEQIKMKMRKMSTMHRKYAKKHFKQLHFLMMGSDHHRVPCEFHLLSLSDFVTLLMSCKNGLAMSTNA